MKYKHTPTPWRAEKYDVSGGYDCITGAIDIVCDGHTVATLDAAAYGQTASWSENPWSRDEMEANARLIAAAPDLLSALEDAVDRAYSGADMNFSGVMLPGWVRDAEAIIAKAKGE